MRVLLLLVIILFTCAPSHDEKVHYLSVQTHDLAIKIGEHVYEKIKRIDLYAEESEGPVQLLLQDSVKSLHKDYYEWESSIVEVPGHEHDHEKHGDHAGHNHHNHEPANSLTPEMILDIQREMRDRIVTLNIRAQKLLNTLEKKNKNEPVEKKEKVTSYGT